MPPLLLFLLKASIVITLTYAFFSLLMKNEAMHRLNRVLLLSAMALAWIIPSLPKIENPLPKLERMTRLAPMMEEPISIGHNEGTQTAELPLSEEASHWEEAGEWTQQSSSENISPVIILYLIGLFIALALYLYYIGSTIQLIRRGKRVKMEGVPDGITVIETSEIDAPCSWMRYIMLNPAEPHDSQQMMLQHEIAHVQLGHSWDLLAAELTARLLWFLPFAWLMRQDLIDVHEFEADEAAIATGLDLDSYQHLLVRKASSRTRLLPVVNSMGQTGVRRRFAMMYTPRRHKSYIKLLGLLPLLLIVLSACSWLTPRDYPLRGWWHFDWIQNTEDEFRHVIPFEQVHVFNDSTMFDIHYSQRSDHVIIFGFQAWDMRWDGQLHKSHDGNDSLSLVNARGLSTAFVMPDPDTHLMIWERQPDQMAIVNGPSITEQWSRCDPDEQLRHWLSSAIEDEAKAWYAEFDQTVRYYSDNDSIATGWIHTYFYLTTNGNKFTLWQREKPLKEGRLDMGGTGICGELDKTGTVNLGSQKMHIQHDKAQPDKLELHFTNNDEATVLKRIDHLPAQFQQMLATMK